MSIDKSNYEIYFIDYLDGTLSETDKKAVDDFLLENPDLAAELEGYLPVLEPSTDSMDLNSLLKPLEWEDAEVTELYIAKLEAKIDGVSIDNSEAFRLGQFEAAFPDLCQNIERLISSTELNPGALIALKERAKLGLLQLETDASHTELIAYLEGDLNSERVQNLETKIQADLALASELELFRKTYLTSEEVVLPSPFKNKLKRKAGLIIPLWAKSLAASAAAVAAVVFLLNGDETTSETTAFTPRTSTFQDLSYDEDSTIEESLMIYDKQLANFSGSNVNTQSAIEIQNSEEYLRNTSNSKFYIPDASSEDQLIADNKVVNESSAVLDTPPDEVLEPLIALSTKSENFTLPSKVQLNKGDLVNPTKIVIPEFEWNYLPAGDDLADKTSKKNDAYTPYEYLQKKVKERLAKDAEVEQGMALAFVNRTAKKLNGSDEDLIAYQKEEESSKGFKFRLGGLFSVERSN